MGSMLRRKVGLFLLVALLLSPAILYAAEKEIFVTKINITGNEALSDEALSFIVKPYEGKNITLSELQRVAAQIAEEYRKQGYILAKAYIPEQKVISGIIEIAVVEGKVGEIKIQGEHKYYSDAFIRKHFDPVINENAVNQDALERALLVLNEYPKLKVKTTFQAGREPGTTDIIVTAENSIPIDFTIDYNNLGSKFVGRNRFGLTFDAGNLIKEGSVLSLRGVTGVDPDDFLFGRATYTIPLSVKGTKLGVYYAAGSYDVGKELEILEMEGKSQNFGMYVSHPFIKKRNLSLAAELGFHAKNAKQYIFGDLFSYDKIRSLRGGITYESTDSTGRTAAAVFITQGLGHLLGAMENDDPMASRFRADNKFTKFNLDIVRLQRIAQPVFLILKGSGQLSSDSLVVIEQFSIGGQDSVRGFPSGEHMGDSGYSVTGELRVSPLKNKELLQLALFIDHGYISVKNPVEGQKKDESLSGAGVGVRLNLPYDFNIRADVGFPLEPSKNSEGKNAVFYLQAVKRF